MSTSTTATVSKKFSNVNPPSSQTIGERDVDISRSTLIQSTPITQLIYLLHSRRQSPRKRTSISFVRVWTESRNGVGMKSLFSYPLDWIHFQGIPLAGSMVLQMSKSTLASAKKSETFATPSMPKHVSSSKEAMSYPNSVFASKTSSGVS